MNALFEIGQKVVCVDSSSARRLVPPPLVEGKTYIVKRLNQCACGGVAIDVGLSTNLKFITCGECGRDRVANGIHWSKQTRFIPLDFDRQADEAIHEALKGVKQEGGFLDGINFE